MALGLGRLGRTELMIERRSREVREGEEEKEEVKLGLVLRRTQRVFAS